MLKKLKECSRELRPRVLVYKKCSKSENLKESIKELKLRKKYLLKLLLLKAKQLLKIQIKIKQWNQVNNSIHRLHNSRIKTNRG